MAILQGRRWGIGRSASERMGDGAKKATSGRFMWARMIASTPRGRAGGYHYSSDSDCFGLFWGFTSFGSIHQLHLGRVCISAWLRLCSCLSVTRWIGWFKRHEIEYDGWVNTPHRREN